MCRRKIRDSSLETGDERFKVTLFFLEWPYQFRLKRVSYSVKAEFKSIWN